MTSFIFAYVTASSADEAYGISRAIVEERLAACANVLPGMRSVYHWQGRIEEADETVILFKTRADLFDALSARVTALHSYETPCIVALPVTAGSAPYLEWLAAETEIS